MRLNQTAANSQLNAKIASIKQETAAKLLHLKHKQKKILNFVLIMKKKLLR